MWNKLKNIYVWTTKVRPIATETYTIADATNTTQSATIYKSGYDIQSVTISTTWACSNVWANYDILIRDNPNNKTNAIWTWSWVWQNESYQNKTYAFTYYLNWTQTYLWNSANFWYATTTVSITWTINRDGTYTADYNGNITSWTFDANWVQALLSALNSNTSCVCFRTNNSWASLTNNTATVTYTAA